MKAKAHRENTVPWYPVSSPDSQLRLPPHLSVPVTTQRAPGKSSLCSLLLENWEHSPQFTFSTAGRMLGLKMYCIGKVEIQKWGEGRGLPSSGSLHKWPQRPGLGASSRSVPWCRGQSAWAVLHGFPGRLSRELDQNWGSLWDAGPCPVFLLRK